MAHVMSVAVVCLAESPFTPSSFEAEGSVFSIVVLLHALIELSSRETVLSAGMCWHVHFEHQTFETPSLLTVGRTITLPRTNLVCSSALVAREQHLRLQVVAAGCRRVSVVRSRLVHTLGVLPWLGVSARRGRSEPSIRVSSVSNLDLQGLGCFRIQRTRSCGSQGALETQCRSTSCSTTHRVECTGFHRTALRGNSSSR